MDTLYQTNAFVQSQYNKQQKWNCSRGSKAELHRFCLALPEHTTVPKPLPLNPLMSQSMAVEIISMRATRLSENNPVGT